MNDFRLIILTLFGVLVLNSCSSQKNETPNHLKGLTLATNASLDGKSIKLDGESFPIYNVEGKVLKGKDFDEAMMSEDLLLDLYLDKNGEVKAGSLREISQEEKQKIEEEMTEKAKKKENMMTSIAPVFNVTDINGTNYSLSDLKGKIVVLNFWFVECVPCIKEMPELNQLVSKYKNKEVVFIGFSTSDKANIDKFLQIKEFNYNIIPNSKDIAKDYLVSAYPANLVIDKNSYIVYYKNGFNSNTKMEIEEVIEKLISE